MVLKGKVSLVGTVLLELPEFNGRCCPDAVSSRMPAIQGRCKPWFLLGFRAQLRWQYLWEFAEQLVKVLELATLTNWQTERDTLTGGAARHC